MTSKTYYITEATAHLSPGRNLMTLTSPELDRDEILPGTIVKITCDPMGIYDREFFVWWASQDLPYMRQFAEVRS